MSNCKIILGEGCILVIKFNFGLNQTFFSLIHLLQKFKQLVEDEALQIFNLAIEKSIKNMIKIFFYSKS